MLKFTKVQGAGNDFVLIDGKGLRRPWSKLTPRLSDRHLGVGGDGVLLVLPSQKADVRMRVFNLDGSEADACGNGLRCVVRYVLETGMVRPRSAAMTVETMSGIRQVRLSGRRKPAIQVSMGKPIFHATDIPVSLKQGKTLDIILDYKLKAGGRELPLNCVSMGNPHAVYFLNSGVTQFPLAEIGPTVEKHPFFPKAVNFEIAQVINRQTIEARVWERGVGETQACGSGACAIAVMARQHGFAGDKVDIKLPGGTLQIMWDGMGEVWLTGDAEIVFNGEWPE